MRSVNVTGTQAKGPVPAWFPGQREGDSLGCPSVHSRRVSVSVPLLSSGSAEKVLEVGARSLVWKRGHHGVIM